MIERQGGAVCFVLNNDSGDVSMGQLCEFVQAINVRLIKCHQALDARLKRLENGAEPSGAATSGVAKPGAALTAPELNYPIPDKTLVNWTTIRTDEVAKHFEGAIDRSTLFLEENSNFRSLQATGAHPV